MGDIIAKARQNGAYTCAPKELALAESHLERTRDELDLGNLFPARDHLQTVQRYVGNSVDAVIVNTAPVTVSVPLLYVIV